MLQAGGARGNPRRHLWTPLSQHLLVICAAGLHPLLKALSLEHYTVVPLMMAVRACVL